MANTTNRTRGSKKSKKTTSKKANSKSLTLFQQIGKSSISEAVTTGTTKIAINRHMLEELVPTMVEYVTGDYGLTNVKLTGVGLSPEGTLIVEYQTEERVTRENPLID